MVFVIGGINTDISGRPKDALLLRDSNIASIGVSVGGVGRNIARNLALHGFEVELIAPLGDDPFSAGVVEDCRKQKIGLRYAPRIPEMRGGIYLCINDAGGDMYVAMNDMRICDALTPELLDMDAVNAGEACVLDANIPAQTLLYIAEHASIPLICDPVSVAKCSRVLPILPRLFAIKPNLYEAQALTGKETPEETARALVEAGVKQAFVSLGSEGICYADAQGCARYKVQAHAPIVSTTGAGDAAAAAICAGCLQKLPIAQTAKAACEAAVAVITRKS